MDRGALPCCKSVNNYLLEIDGTGAVKEKGRESLIPTYGRIQLVGDRSNGIIPYRVRTESLNL